ncbi:hypothetical protein ACUN0C_19360 [Faunimonas sp. B44]|uniref:hypothetical protein n=1 Tax=Faunimonas sp. B44 TaxID=3461493 RepID=UPI004044FE7A
MQFTTDFDWSVADFALAGAVLFGSVPAYELTLRRTRNRAFRAATALALATALILTWMNGAVGIIGSEELPANALYWIVLTVGAVGATIARFRPRGMAVTLIATALAQALVPLVAGAAGVSLPDGEAFEILALTGVFVILWLVSAWLFQTAAFTPGGEASIR